MKIKRFIALALAAMLLVSMSAVGMSAKTAKTPNTYAAQGNIYSNSKGAVYVTHNKGKYLNKLVYKPSKGKAVTLAQFDSYDIYAVGARFYLRGNTVYYSLNTQEADNGVYSVDTSGKNKKLLVSKATLTGGYGSKVIYRLNGSYYSLYNGKTNKLTAAKNAVLFNGKLYTDSGKAVDLKSGKTTSFAKLTAGSGHYKNMMTSKKYLYYINASGSLISLDRNDSKTKIAANVSAVLGANNGKTVVYLKKNTVYRSTGNSAVKLIGKKALPKSLGYKNVSDCEIYAAEVYGNKILLGVNFNDAVNDEFEYGSVTVIASINKNGGKVRKEKTYTIGDMFDSYTEATILLTDFAAFNGSISCTYKLTSADTDGWNDYLYRSYNIM